MEVVTLGEIVDGGVELGITCGGDVRGAVVETNDGGGFVVGLLPLWT